MVGGPENKITRVDKSISVEVLIKGIRFKKSQGCSDRYIKDHKRVLIFGRDLRERITFIILK